MHKRKVTKTRLSDDKLDIWGELGRSQIPNKKKEGGGGRGTKLKEPKLSSHKKSLEGVKLVPLGA